MAGFRHALCPLVLAALAAFPSPARAADPQVFQATLSRADLRLQADGRLTDPRGPVYAPKLTAKGLTLSPAPETPTGGRACTGDGAILALAMEGAPPVALAPAPAPSTEACPLPVLDRAWVRLLRPLDGSLAEVARLPLSLPLDSRAAARDLDGDGDDDVLVLSPRGRLTAVVF
ncbi:MAG: hypothetical protein KDE22_14560 [Rhodobacterales bacterium]|nr:hypothetical protein [Rhodobacterales bacterium]